MAIDIIGFKTWTYRNGVLRYITTACVKTIEFIKLIENYLCDKLDFSERHLLSKLRCSNIKLSNRFSNNQDDK